ncbi:MAG TPA: hypothetical protein VEQ11_13375 [Chloroflexota bacterium]|nr:hypothetical protein [Chloroflexota bacterium]
MNKTDAAAGFGMAAIMAICCAGPLLVLALPALALVTGQVVLIAAAAAVAVIVIAVFTWRRRSSGCLAGSCDTHAAAPPARSQVEDVDPAAATARHEQSAAGSGRRR